MKTFTRVLWKACWKRENPLTKEVTQGESDLMDEDAARLQADRWRGGWDTDVWVEGHLVVVTE